MVSMTWRVEIRMPILPSVLSKIEDILLKLGTNIPWQKSMDEFVYGCNGTTAKPTKRH